MGSAPEICGFYSVNADREYEDSTLSLRYFIKPKLPINLNVGIDKIRPKPATYYREKMEHILTFIVNHRNELSSTQGSEQKLIPCAQYITYRGIVKKIMCSKISKYPWTIVATKYRGNIYLCQHASIEEIEKETNPDPETKKFCNYGPMFEHYCLSEHPGTDPDTSQVCDASPQFFCVFRRNLVNRTFLFAGEIDGVESDKPLDTTKPREWKPSDFVELKLNCELNSGKRVIAFANFKSHNIWAQSYLAGVEKVHVGFRDESGIVKQIRCYSIREMEKISRKIWKNPMDGFELLSTFETDLKDIDCPYTTIKYEFHPNKGLSSTLHSGKTEYTLLPEWYLQKMQM